MQRHEKLSEKCKKSKEFKEFLAEVIDLFPNSIEFFVLHKLKVNSGICGTIDDDQISDVSIRNFDSKAKM